MVVALGKLYLFGEILLRSIPFMHKYIYARISGR